MIRTIGTLWTLLFVLSASVVTAQPQALNEERWTTIAEEGWWTMDNGKRIDLSRSLKVIRNVETGRERVVPQAFGTASQTIETFPFSAFQMISSSVFWTEDIVTGYGERVGSQPVAFAYAPVQVPSGLRVEGIEVEGCDETLDGELFVNFVKCEVFEPACTGVGGYVVATGETDTPGCATFFNSPENPHTIDNFHNVYKLALADTSPGGGVVRLRSVRLYLRRQVSPPPTTATFDDVPTDHLFFQHIAALAASAVTAGCDADSFCPDAPLTRGQMAVFLAEALGLHWPH